MNRSLALFSVASILGLGMQQAAPNPPEPPKPATGQVPAGHPQIPIPKVGEEWPKAAPEDVGSVEAIIKAFYEAPAGAPGEARNWARYMSLFVPDARLIAARQGPDGTSGAMFLAVTEYIAANRTYMEKGGFQDKEIARRVEEFGCMVQVWSTYESRRKATDPAPYVRGINSIQLLKDANRYWIVNVFWDYEKPDRTIPDKYLATPRE